MAPVLIEGRKIAHSFWGKAWCENLERYSDFENRLPRGRSYVRNGLIVDLQIEQGTLRALVSGSALYNVKIDIAVAAPSRWKAICKDCAGSVGSLVELLQGKLSKNVMERVCREGDGLFPAPREIKVSCSCPDWADMCKHVAAALYGVGARLDAAPDLLFTLRGVDRAQLIAADGADLPAGKDLASDRILADDDIGALFGIEVAPPTAPLQPNRKKLAPPGAHSGDRPKPSPGREAAKRSSLSAQRHKEALIARGRAAKKPDAATPKAAVEKRTTKKSGTVPSNHIAAKDVLGRAPARRRRKGRRRPMRRPGSHATNRAMKMDRRPDGRGQQSGSMQRRAKLPGAARDDN